MLNVMLNLFLRDLRLAHRRRGEVLQNVMFFVVVCSLFPLGIGPEVGILKTIAPGVIWVSAFLSTILSLNRLFLNDYQDGSLEQLVLSEQPLSMLLLAKIAAYWVTSSLPIVLLSPFIGMQFGLDLNLNVVLALGLLIGTPILSMLGAIGASLTLGLRGGGVLMSLLVLPLCIPTLIFGAGAVSSVSTGLDVSANFLILFGFFTFCLGFAPVTVGFSVRAAFI